MKPDQPPFSEIVGMSNGADRPSQQPDPVSKGAKFIGWWLGLCTVLLVSLVAITFAWASTQESSRTSRAVQGSCQFYRDLSELPLTSTSTRPLLIIIADARIAYETAECYRSKGPLSDPDPRMLPYLGPR